MGQRHFDAMLQQAVTIDRRATRIARVIWFHAQRDMLGSFPSSFNQAMRIARCALVSDEDYQQHLVSLVQQRRVFCLDVFAERPRYGYNPKILEVP